MQRHDFSNPVFKANGTEITWISFNNWYQGKEINVINMDLPQISESSFTFQFTVNDGQHSLISEITITITNEIKTRGRVDKPLRIAPGGTTSLTVSTNEKYDEAKHFIFPIALVYSLTQSDGSPAPDWITYNETAETFTLSPPISHPLEVTYHFRLHGTNPDDSSTAFLPWDFKVNNTLPTIDNFNNFSATEGISKRKEFTLQDGDPNHAPVLEVEEVDYPTWLSSSYNQGTRKVTFYSDKVGIDAQG